MEDWASEGHDCQGSEQEAVEEARGMQVWGCQQFGCEPVVGRGGDGDRDNEDSGNFAVFSHFWDSLKLRKVELTQKGFGLSRFVCYILS